VGRKVSDPSSAESKATQRNVGRRHSMLGSANNEVQHHPWGESDVKAAATEFGDFTRKPGISFQDSFQVATGRSPPKRTQV
jgi:hypothetical protein